MFLSMPQCLYIRLIVTFDIIVSRLSYITSSLLEVLEGTDRIAYLFREKCLLGLQILNFEVKEIFLYFYYVILFVIHSCILCKICI